MSVVLGGSCSLSPGRIAAVGATALGVLVLLDLPWLGLVVRELYAAQLGDLLAPRTDVVAAALFYVVYVGGLLHFAIPPAPPQSGCGGGDSVVREARSVREAWSGRPAPREA